MLVVLMSVLLYLAGFGLFRVSRIMRGYWIDQHNLLAYEDTSNLLRQGCIGLVNLLGGALVIYGLYMAFKAKWWYAIIAFIIGKLVVFAYNHKLYNSESQARELSGPVPDHQQEPIEQKKYSEPVQVLFVQLPNGDQLRRGDIIQHDTFGAGKVLSTYSDEIEADFKSRRKVMLSLEFAPIRKVRSAPPLV